MAGSRTLKLSILADVDDLKKKLGSADQEVQGFGGKLGDFGKKAAAAFAVAGAAAAAYAGKLLVDGVKAAIEDEAAQAKLAKSLQNVTGATTAQISAVEDQILKTSLLTGLTDDELRPSLDRLVRATKDVEQAQKLQTLAIDVAAGSGKSLEAVTNAMAKAAEGNTSALGRLGVGLSTAELKSMSLEEITESLARTFAGQASEQADTFQGKMARLSVAFAEGKETVGSFVLDAITPLVTLLVNDLIPRLSELATNIGEKLKPVFEDISTFFTEILIPAFKEWWKFLTESVIPGIIKTVKPIIEGLFSAFNQVANTIKANEDNLKPLFELFKKVAEFVVKYLAPAIGTTLGQALKIVGTLLSGLITGFSKLVGFIQNVIDKIKKLIELIKSNPLVQGIGNLISSAFGGGRAVGGSVASNTGYMVGERGPEMFVPNSGGKIVPNNRLGGQTINITVNGAIDPIGTARTISDILGREATTNGTINNLGISRLIAV